ncbi:hypothetical protein KR093_002692 [Drosophila rubida]|uniref:Myb/SANT-like DNA-binding domain-containing protein n=1 Tax=Drosophila rubida TaxID=30044 RepID=A0AAD4K2V1_9MUSC|nr:hypothetical protein KR093_002692 [Drosophila rubida]
MDYDNLSLNIGGGSQASGAVSASVNGGINSNSNAELEADGNMCGSQELLEVKSKEKARRYWTPSEEERLYEIWGRDNWRLTRNGKNTIFFGQWSEELRERFSVDVKPEEIQMKVNQTRAKFRQVKKQIQSDPSSYHLRWKKYDIINRILKNIHRPKNADPIPPEILLNNRDVSPPREDEQQQQQQAQTNQQQPQQPQSVLNLTSEATGNNFYSNNSSNSNNSSSHVQVNSNNNNTMSFNTELFTDQYDDIKREYDEEDYRSMPFQEQMQQYSPAEPTQLLELQTPQQQQQQQQQQQFQSEYESSVANYTAGGNSTQQQQQQQYNASSSSNNPTSTSSINHQAITAVAYINSSNNTISVATNSNSNGGPMTVQMQPPVGVGAATNTVASIPTPRKRGRPFGSGNPPAADSLESIYIEEVRRKNQLLSEQTKISRQRLELEERKVELMQTFFPKCLEQQAHILARVMQLPSLQQHSQPQQLQSSSLPPQQ